MKNIDFKMRERFHRREQDTDRQLEREYKELAKMKAAHYAEDTDGVSEKAYERMKELAERSGRYA